ncbi:MAG: hypothetical protein WCA08_17805, partial [Desulfoferrobacter sp.]
GPKRRDVTQRKPCCSVSSIPSKRSPWNDNLLKPKTRYVSLIKAVGRRIESKESEGVHVLHESTAAYRAGFRHEMGSLTPKNALPWNVYDESSTT